MLNFPLYGSTLDVFARGRPTAELGYRIRSMLRVHQHPQLMPSFVDNHDVDRFLAGGSEAGLKQSLLLMLTLLGVSMFPQVAVLSGMFELIQALGLFNRTLGLVVPYTIFTLPFTVWILTTFMRELPGELEEAAIMDGCSPLRIIFQVFLPLLWPALVSTGLLAFIGAWNEFLFALTFIVEDDQRTVPVGISMIAGATAYEIPWGSIMAASVIVTLPLLGLVLVFQKKIVSGLTAGAVKG